MAIILGIDPGSRITGFGVIEVAGTRERCLDCGEIRLNVGHNHQKRLKALYDRLIEIIEEHLPDECAVEMPVYGRNAQSMLKLGRAQATVMLAALNRDIPVAQYTPKEVKKSVTGVGNASKSQVGYMVKSILELSAEVSADLSPDASDALAVGLCHAHRQTQASAPQFRNWAGFVKANPGRVRGR